MFGVLLTTTLESYFKGDRELFEGLKIMALEKDWEQYPVFHKVPSSAFDQPTENMKDALPPRPWLRLTTEAMPFPIKPKPVGS